MLAVTGTRQNQTFCPHLLHAKFSLVETKGEYTEEETCQRGLWAAENRLAIFHKGEEDDRASK